VEIGQYRIPVGQKQRVPQKLVPPPLLTLELLYDVEQSILVVQTRHHATNQKQPLLCTHPIVLRVLEGTHQHTVQCLTVPVLQTPHHLLQGHPLHLVFLFPLLQVPQHLEPHCESQLGRHVTILKGTVQFEEDCDYVVDVPFSREVEGFKGRGDMLDAEQVCPVAGGGGVERGKLGRKVVVFLQNGANCMLEFIEILLGSSFERNVVSIDPEIHEFDFAIKCDSDVVEGKVSMSYPHVIEEGVDPQELLHVLVHVLGVVFEGISFRVEGSWEVLKGLVVVR
jgi:hypothetical protein